MGQKSSGETTTRLGRAEDQMDPRVALNWAGKFTDREPESIAI